MSISLTDILRLVGQLDDSVGPNSSRERFRSFLKDNIVDVGQLGDYIEECLRNKGPQYNRALQDLVNRLGIFLGFEVEFGRYQGVHGEIGFDGIWKSEDGFFIVVEVKTTDAYSIKTSILTGYIDALISDKKIPDWDSVVGLYVVGRVDSGLRELENSIIAEKRTQQLRIVTVESLLKLAEIKNEYDIENKDVLSILKPSGPRIDPVVDLISKVIAQTLSVEEISEENSSVIDVSEGDVEYWLTPVKDDENRTAIDVIKDLVEKHKVYAFADRTPGRKMIKPGDRICFYATQMGVVADAEVASKPVEKEHPAVHNKEHYRWVFDLKNVRVYSDNPVIIDNKLREKLDAFRNKDPTKGWAWFVQATRRVSKHDFELLTGSQ